MNEGAELAAKDNLYRCQDLLLKHKEALLGFLKERWQDLFGVKYEVLLYDLTSTYFESDPPSPKETSAASVIRVIIDPIACRW